MVLKQNESLTAQVQILKNNVQGIFQFTDATYTAIGYQNRFHMTVSLMIADLQGLIVEGEDGSKTLTDFGMAIQDIAVAGMEALHEVIMQIIPVIKDFSQEGFLNVEMLRLYTLPLRLLVDLLDMAGPYWTKMLMTFYIMNKVLPITTALQLIQNIVLMMYARQLAVAAGFQGIYNTLLGVGTGIMNLAAAAKFRLILSYKLATFHLSLMTAGQVAFNIAFYVGIGFIILIAYYLGKMIYQSQAFSDIIEYFTEPGGAMYRWINGLQQIWELIKAIGASMKYVAGGIAGVIGAGAGMLDFGTPMMAAGGYLKPMQSGGYVVGERGPELFKPSGGGQLLNNTATNHIMSQGADSGFSGGGGNMTVTSLTVENAEMNQSNLNIDSFAGNPAMKQVKKAMGQGRFG